MLVRYQTALRPDTTPCATGPTECQPVQRGRNHTRIERIWEASAEPINAAGIAGLLPAPVAIDESAAGSAEHPRGPPGWPASDVRR